MKGHDPFVVKPVFSITEHKILFAPSQLPCDSTRDLCQAVMIPSWFNKVETRYIIQPLSHPFTGTLIAVTTLKDRKRERQSSQAPRHYLRKGFVTYLVQSFSSWITPTCSRELESSSGFRISGSENCCNIANKILTSLHIDIECKDHCVQWEKCIFIWCFWWIINKRSFKIVPFNRRWNIQCILNYKQVVKPLSVSFKVSLHKLQMAEETLKCLCVNSRLKLNSDVPKWFV